MRSSSSFLKDNNHFSQNKTTQYNKDIPPSRIQILKLLDIKRKRETATQYFLFYEEESVSGTTNYG